MSTCWRSRVFRWLVNPRRKLPADMTLGELADGGLNDYESHADRAPLCRT
jgi:hypothetical protein